MKYRKKPVVIDAVQFKDCNLKEMEQFIEVNFSVHFDRGPSAILLIPTLEGDHEAKDGDWIIRGVAGEFYPCKPDIFEKTYEVVE